MTYFVRDISIYEFKDTYKESIRKHLKAVMIQYHNQFWYIMDVVPLFTDTGMVWDIYLKDRKYDSMEKVTVNENQTFGYSQLSKTFFFVEPEPETQTITDLEEIKQTLRADTILDVTVSGVPMKLIRVQEIAKGILFFVFQDEEKNKRYYYNRPAIKLRIVTDPNAEIGTKKYLLDHIKAMHID